MTVTTVQTTASASDVLTDEEQRAVRAAKRMYAKRTATRNANNHRVTVKSAHIATQQKNRALLLDCYDEALHKNIAVLASALTFADDSESTQSATARESEKSMSTKSTQTTKSASTQTTRVTADDVRRAQRAREERQKSERAQKSERKSSVAKKNLGAATLGGVRIASVPRENSPARRLLDVLPASAWILREEWLRAANIDPASSEVPWRQAIAGLRYALHCEREIREKREYYRRIANALAATEQQRNNALAKRAALTVSDAASEKSTKSTRAAAASVQSAQTTQTTKRRESASEKRARIAAAAEIERVAREKSEKRERAAIARAAKREAQTTTK